MRERIRAKLGPELSADLFPDHSPLDVPVAELSATLASMPKKTAGLSFRGVPQARDNEESRTSVTSRARFLAEFTLSGQSGDPSLRSG